MAGRKENLKLLFKNTRTRVILIFTTLLLVIAVAIGVYKLKFSDQPTTSEANIGNVPGIQSIPGALNPTAQYAKLQETQNVHQATTALKSGGSAIPTIIRTQTIGDGVQPIGQPSSGTSGVGFSTLAREDEAGTQRSLWLQSLQNNNCSKAAVTKVISEGASLNDLKNACSCIQLKDNGYQLADLEQICTCKELRAAGFNARQLKDAGYSAGRLRLCGFDACALRNAGFTAQQMKDGGFSDDELKGAGFPENEIAKASGLPSGINEADVRRAGCQEDALRRLRAAGVSAAAIRRISGCNANQLKNAGYNAADLRNAGFTAAELKRAGLTPTELRQGGFTARDLLNAGFNTNDLTNAGFTPSEISAAEAELPSGISAANIKKANCDIDTLRKERLAGVSAAALRQTAGCSAEAMKAAGYSASDLKNAGFTAAELKNAGFNAADLKGAGFSAKELRDAGFNLADLKNAGYTAGQLKDAGFTPTELRNAGFNAADLKNAGYSAADLKNAGLSAEALRKAGYPAKDLVDAGFTAEQLQNAGYSDADIQNAGLHIPGSQVAGLANANLPGAGPSNVTPLPSIPGAEPNSAAVAQAENARQLQEILKKQNQQLADQKYQQKIQQRISQMLGTANQSLQNWQKVTTQVYVAGSEPEHKEKGHIPGSGLTADHPLSGPDNVGNANNPQHGAIIKTGDVLFAVLDTSVNSDEPGPILATIVSGKLKGAKLIGSFNLPTNASKMVISFNTMSVPGAAKTTSISAYAIDPNTARTALSSKTNHHFLLRYGSLFASSFLEGIGNAFQSADTTVTIGGTGGGQNITVQNGIGRSTLQNAVIGLATLGKAWGQVAQQQFSTPTTVEVYSGTGLGILFTQDVPSL